MVSLVQPVANDRVEGNISPVARLYYAASTTICCAHAISEGGRMVLGSQAGEARLAEVFRKAGFTRFRRAAETPFNLILEARRSEEHTSELQSLMRISYAVFCLKKKTTNNKHTQ